MKESCCICGKTEYLFSCDIYTTPTVNIRMKSWIVCSKECREILFDLWRGITVETSYELAVIETVAKTRIVRDLVLEERIKKIERKLS